MKAKSIEERIEDIDTDLQEQVLGQALEQIEEEILSQAREEMDEDVAKQIVAVDQERYTLTDNGTGRKDEEEMLEKIANYIKEEIDKGYSLDDIEIQAQGYRPDRNYLRVFFKNRMTGKKSYSLKVRTAKKTQLTKEEVERAEELQQEIKEEREKRERERQERINQISEEREEKARQRAIEKLEKHNLSTEIEDVSYARWSQRYTFTTDEGVRASVEFEHAIDIDESEEYNLKVENSYLKGKAYDLSKEKQKYEDRIEKRQATIDRCKRLNLTTQAEEHRKKQRFEERIVEVLEAGYMIFDDFPDYYEDYSVEEYNKCIPDSVLEKYEEAKEIDLFDEIWILEERDDPLLLGKIEVEGRKKHFKIAGW